MIEYAGPKGRHQRYRDDIYILAHVLRTCTLYVPSAARQGVQIVRAVLPFTTFREKAYLATFIGKCGRAGHI